MKETSLSKIFKERRPEVKGEVKQFLPDMENAMGRELRLKRLRYKHGTEKIGDTKKESRY